MRTLIYKRTHTGDPDRHGWFGVYDCMGHVRSWEFDAVIGVGGIGAEPTSHGIDGRVTWIGIGPRKIPAEGGRGPLVTFDRFVLFDADGPSLLHRAPFLARRLYERNVRVSVAWPDGERTARRSRDCLRARPGARNPFQVTPPRPRAKSANPIWSFRGKVLPRGTGKPGLNGLGNGITLCKPPKGGKHSEIRPVEISASPPPKRGCRLLNQTRGLVQEIGNNRPPKFLELLWETGETPNSLFFKNKWKGAVLFIQRRDPLS